MSIILMILVILLGGFGVTSESAPSVAVAAPATVRPLTLYTISPGADPAYDEMVVIHDLQGTAVTQDDESMAMVTVLFENVSGTDLALVEITLTCQDRDGEVIDTVQHRFENNIADSTTTSGDLEVSTETCDAVDAHVSDIEN